MDQRFQATCPICSEKRTFVAPDDYAGCRDGLKAIGCPLNDCVTRERAAAAVLFSMFSREQLKELRVHEAAPGERGLSLWLWYNITKKVFSGYYPDKPFGTMVGHIRNENLEAQTFPDRCFDLVVHLDVMEHLFEPFKALAEIFRTLDFWRHMHFHRTDLSRTHGVGTGGIPILRWRPHFRRARISREPAGPVGFARNVALRIRPAAAHSEAHGVRRRGEKNAVKGGCRPWPHDRGLCSEEAGIG
ncbi:MAG: methyltransferase domain-containing protein [Mesorhizobium sp.]|nr:methyltransferase domain-containing protein [Mesorhizobium sp. M00.F.Ca.ET.038.03.1.1]RWE99215.1 MAG: methyltransferase domain-containing protein [Mesorhizobium sp.]